MYKDAGFGILLAFWKTPLFILIVGVIKHIVLKARGWFENNATLQTAKT
jgi:hypothetical protein